MSSELARAAGFVLRQIARRANLAIADEIAVEPDGVRFRVLNLNAAAGPAMRVASGLVPIVPIQRGGEALVAACELHFALAAAELGERPAAMACKGTFRVHFNRHGAAPLVWCVATDQWELAVASVAIAGAEVRTVYRAKPTPDDEDGKPSAWLEVTGVLAIDGGEARITR